MTADVHFPEGVGSVGEVVTREHAGERGTRLGVGVGVVVGSLVGVEAVVGGVELEVERVESQLHVHGVHLEGSEKVDVSQILETSEAGNVVLGVREGLGAYATAAVSILGILFGQTNTLSLQMEEHILDVDSLGLGKRVENLLGREQPLHVNGETQHHLNTVVRVLASVHEVHQVDGTVDHVVIVVAVLRGRKVQRSLKSSNLLSSFGPGLFVRVRNFGTQVILSVRVAKVLQSEVLGKDIAVHIQINGICDGVITLRHSVLDELLVLSNDLQSRRSIQRAKEQLFIRGPRFIEIGRHLSGDNRCK